MPKQAPASEFSVKHTGWGDVAICHKGTQIFGANVHHHLANCCGTYEIRSHYNNTYSSVKSIPASVWNEYVKELLNATKNGCNLVAAIPQRVNGRFEYWQEGQFLAALKRAKFKVHTGFNHNSGNNVHFCVYTTPAKKPVKRQPKKV